MKITITPTNEDNYSKDHPRPTITISYPYDDMGIEEWYENIIRPMLVAQTFSGESVDKFFGMEER